MAWTATENFESYSDNDNISGGSGGANWSGNWATPTGTVTVQDEQAVEGSLSLKYLQATNNTYETRNHTATSGDLYYALYCSTASPTNFQCNLRNGGGSQQLVRISSTNIEAYNFSVAGWVDIGDYTAGTWLYVHHNFDQSGQTYKIRTGVSSWSAFSADFGTRDTNDITFLSIGADSQSGTTGYIDDIRADDPFAAAGSLIKSVNGVLRANIKSWNGVILE